MSEKKRRLLITATDFPPQKGGVATYSWEVANAFQKKGFDVTVITRKPLEKRMASNFKIIEISLPQAGLLAMPLLSLHLVRHLRQNTYDHILSTLWMPGGLAVFNAKKILGLNTKNSLCVHAMEIVESKENWKKKLRGFLSPLKKKCFQNADSIFCVSQFSKELLQKTLSLSGKKIFVVPNGVNPNNFSPLKIDNSQIPYPRLVTACRLMPHKGIDQVIQALPKLVQDFPNIQYHIVGGGPDEHRLKKLVSQNKLIEHVQFLGRIDHHRLQEEYSKAHLFVCLIRRCKL